MLANFKWIAWLLALGVAGAAPAWAQEGPPPAGPVTYQVFYDALSPYGQWVQDPDYGYAWVPTAGPDFQPYRTSGHWVYTDYGWTWVSDYQWGWAAFHYGRWRYSDLYGWLWVPGYSWGPAWVAWRQSAGYYGWAPLGPPPPRPGGVHLNIGFSFSFGDAPAAPAQWCFVPAAYVASPALATYYVPPAQTTVVYNRTTIIHNTYVANNVTNVTNNTVVNQPGAGGTGQGGRRGQPAFPAGPAPADVEKATGQPLTPLAVSNRDKPGVGVQGKSLAFYRPEVAAPAPVGTQSAGTGANPAPRNVVPLAQAASLARRPLADPNRGLLRDNAVRHLNSTEPDPIRVAKQQAQAAAASSPGPTAGNSRAAAATRPGNAGPAATAAPGIANATTAAKQPAKAQPAPGQLATAPAAPAAATPPSRPAPSDPAWQPDRDQQRQTQQLAQQPALTTRQQQQAQQQGQAARQQQQQAKQQQQDQQQVRQQQEQARQAQQQQVRQQQEQARQAQQQARQARQQARPPRPEGRPEHR